MHFENLLSKSCFWYNRNYHTSIYKDVLNKRKRNPYFLKRRTINKKTLKFQHHRILISTGQHLALECSSIWLEELVPKSSLILLDWRICKFLGGGLKRIREEKSKESENGKKWWTKGVIRFEEIEHENRGRNMLCRMCHGPFPTCGATWLNVRSTVEPNSVVASLRFMCRPLNL